MKITRKQLRKLIEAKIKPTLDIPGLGDRAQQNLYKMAADRDLDSAGRQSADNTLDSLVGAFQFDEEPFSKREFEYDYPLIEDPEFAKNVANLFEIFMYENKLFANDIDDGMPLEGYKEMSYDFFIDELPSMVNKPGYFRGKTIPSSISHTFSSGKVPYQLEGEIRKIIDPISSRIWNDWTSSEYFG